MILMYFISLRITAVTEENSQYYKIKDYAFKTPK